MTCEHPNSPASMSTDPIDIEKKALANLLDAVEGVLYFSWADDGDLDEDAAQAIDRLRLARNEYGVIQRVKNVACDTDLLEVPRSPQTLISRLRDKAAMGGIIPIHDVTINEAANEIERLRDALEKVARIKAFPDASTNLTTISAMGKSRVLRYPKR